MMKTDRLQRPLLICFAPLTCLLAAAAAFFGAFRLGFGIGTNTIAIVAYSFVVCFCAYGICIPRWWKTLPIALTGASPFIAIFVGVLFVMPSWEKAKFREKFGIPSEQRILYYRGHDFNGSATRFAMLKMRDDDDDRSTRGMRSGKAPEALDSLLTSVKSSLRVGTSKLPDLDKPSIRFRGQSYSDGQWRYAKIIDLDRRREWVVAKSF